MDNVEKYIELAHKTIVEYVDDIQACEYAAFELSAGDRVVIMAILGKMLEEQRKTNELLERLIK